MNDYTELKEFLKTERKRVQLVFAPYANEYKDGCYDGAVTVLEAVEEWIRLQEEDLVKIAEEKRREAYKQINWRYE